jgi:hypothetical protein
LVWWFGGRRGWLGFGVLNLGFDVLRLGSMLSGLGFEDLTGQAAGFGHGERQASRIWARGVGCPCALAAPNHLELKSWSKSVEACPEDRRRREAPPSRPTARNAGLSPASQRHEITKHEPMETREGLARLRPKLGLSLARSCTCSWTAAVTFRLHSFESGARVLRLGFTVLGLGFEDLAAQAAAPGY